MSTRVIGVVKMHRVKSAKARVAIKVFLAVLISEKNYKTSLDYRYIDRVRLKNLK